MVPQAGLASSVFDKAPVYPLKERADDPATTLNRLLQKNHTAHAVLRNPRLLFHNHIPHALGSSYLLGASGTKLEEIYAAESPSLAAVDSVVLHDAIVAENWREHLGQKKYTAAYVDYFDSEIEKNAGDWKKVAEYHLYSGTEPLVHGLCGGLGHPFIHLAYGYEFESKEVISEALSLGCTEYDQTHKYLDCPPPDNSTYKTTNLAEILNKLHKDSRFDGYSKDPGYANIFTLLTKYESTVMQHWNALVVNNATTQFMDWLKTATVLAVSTKTKDGEYDFYLAHVLTVGHALRILLPVMPEQQRIPAMKQYGLFTILIYLAQLRPSFREDQIEPNRVEFTEWDAIYKEALQSKWSNDLHWPKVTRALRMVEELRGPENDFYKQAATKFVLEFNGWTGFGLGADAL